MGPWGASRAACPWDAVLVTAGSHHGLYGPCELCRCGAASFLVDTWSCISISLHGGTGLRLCLYGCPALHLSLSMDARGSISPAGRTGFQLCASSPAPCRRAEPFAPQPRAESDASLPPRDPRSSTPPGAVRWWPSRGGGGGEEEGGGGGRSGGGARAGGGALQAGEAPPEPPRGSGSRSSRCRGDAGGGGGGSALSGGGGAERGCGIGGGAELRGAKRGL